VARSKRERVAQTIPRAENPAELPIVSPRRDVLAWARKPVLATALSCKPRNRSKQPKSNTFRRFTTHTRYPMARYSYTSRKT